MLIPLIVATLQAAAVQGPATRVPYAISCATCRIEIERLVSLGTADDPVLTAFEVVPVQDSKGRWFAASFDRYQIVSFDAEGKFVQTFARKGEGPGEIAFGGIVHLLVGPGDSLYVVQNARVSVFDALQRHVRTFQIPPGSVTKALLLPNGSLLLGANFGTPSSFGLPLHMFDRQGVLVRSFGDSKALQLSDDATLNSRGTLPPAMVALEQDGRAVWAAPGYRIRQLKIDGSPGLAFDVHGSPWFPPTRDSSITDRAGRSVRVQVGGGSTTLTGIDNGVLWISASRSASSAAEKSTNALEAVDARTGNILATLPTQSFMKWVGPGLFRSIAVDKDGVWTHTVWRVRLRRPQGGSNSLSEP